MNPDNVGMMKKENIIEIYTDGSCRGNPGPGGWGVLLRYGDHEKTLSGGEANTTNNRMELMAAIMGLRSLNRACKGILITDSEYVKNGITKWLEGWKAKNWRTAANKPVKNQDLWEMLDLEVKRHDIEWQWVKGHSGHVENERVDQLAKDALEAFVENGKNACDK